MYNNRENLDTYLSETYKNLVGLVDVLRLSVLPSKSKTNYPTVEEDGITYYMLDYKRFNNIEETLKIPHLTDLVSNSANLGYISANISNNNIPDSTSDNLIVNFNNPNIDKLTFKSRYEIHNFKEGKGYFGNFSDVIIGHSEGMAAFVEYDFEELINFGTDKNDIFTDNIKLKVDIAGVSNYKYSKNISAFSGSVPSVIYHGVHGIYPEGIGFDAIDKNISYIKQSIYNKEKMLEFVSNGFILNIETVTDRLNLTFDKGGIKNNGKVLYDIAGNSFRDTSFRNSNIIGSTLNTNFLKVNRFKTLNYSYNNNKNDGMILGWDATSKQPMVGINRNNSESYFNSYNVGFKDDDLQSYFSASYFDFNTKIKFYKTTDLGDEEYNWGSYFKDTRNIFNNSKIEVGNSSELYIDTFAKMETYGSISIRNKGLSHMSKRIKKINKENVTDGYTVFVVDTVDNNKLLIEYGMTHVGTEFVVINNTGSVLNLYSIDSGENETNTNLDVPTNGVKTFIKTDEETWYAY